MVAASGLIPPSYIFNIDDDTEKFAISSEETDSTIAAVHRKPTNV